VIVLKTTLVLENCFIVIFCNCDIIGCRKCVLCNCSSGQGLRGRVTSFVSLELTEAVLSLFMCSWLMFFYASVDNVMVILDVTVLDI